MCIRDSLYRLARSAERRHKCDNPSSGDKDEKDTSGSLLPDGSNKYALPNSYVFYYYFDFIHKLNEKYTLFARKYTFGMSWKL